MRRREMGKGREKEKREGVKTKWEGKERRHDNEPSDTSSCFYGDQGANRVALLRTVLLKTDKRVDRGGCRCFSVFVRQYNLPVAHLQVVSSCFLFRSGSLPRHWYQ